jgi:hypothetical protein
VREADWSPDGTALAVVHFVDGQDQLEYPPGRLIDRTNDWLNHPRFAPDGRWLAYQHMRELFLSARDGKPTAIEEAPDEIAWLPPTGELVLSQVIEGATHLRARRVDGRIRELGTLPGDFVLHDISLDGRLLLSRVFQSSEIFVSRDRNVEGRPLALFDRSEVVDVSADGIEILFSEQGGARRRSVSGVPLPGSGRLLPDESVDVAYLRRTDGGPARRLGEASPTALSRDAAWVLGSTFDEDGQHLVLLPTGPGTARPISTAPVVDWGNAGFFPDDRAIFFMGSVEGHGRRAWVMRLDGSAPVAISPEGVRRGMLSGDGRYVSARAADGVWYLYPTTPGDRRPIAGLRPGEEPVQWSGDGRAVYVRGADEPDPGTGLVSAVVYRLDPWTGARELWKRIPPVDPLMGGGIGTILFAEEGRTCVYTHRRYSSDLFLAEGLR